MTRLYSHQKLVAQTKAYLSHLHPIETDEDIRKLQDLIKEHQRAYYQLNKPYISDEDFDELFELLKKTEKKIHHIPDDSPTKNVGSDIKTQTNKRAHHISMLSLENAFNSSDLEKFDKRVHDALSPEVNQITYVVEPKIDGVSISLLYEQDKLIRATTRGNGIEGDDVTSQAHVIDAIPQSTKLSQFNIERCEVRGEVYLSKKQFAQINKELEVNQEKLFANARNTVAGSLRMKDLRTLARRRLHFFAYQLIPIHVKKAIHANNQSEIINLLSRAKLPTTALLNSTCHNIKKVEEHCISLEARRAALDFDIDGAVIKVNNINQQHRIGKTSHHPKWAIAYKFKARKTISTIEYIEFQVGRTGSITPVSKITPVNISGATVSSVSLFNADFLVEHDLRIGDQILVKRSGDVIPYIEKNLDQKDLSRTNPKINFPTHCPSCNSELKKEKEETVWRCKSRKCPEQLALQIVHFVSKVALDINGLGEQYIRILITKGMVSSVEDIFNLPFKRIVQIDGFGDKAVHNLQRAIEYAKHHTEMHRILYGLGIRYVGIHTAEILCASVDTLHDFVYSSKESLEAIKGIGPKAAQATFSYFQAEKNKQRIYKLQELGVILTNQSSATRTSNILKGKSFLFTGALSEWKRSEAESIIKQHGGTIASSVHKNLNYLVAGDQAGSKLKKANEYEHITIISETEFGNFIQNLDKK